MAPYPAPPPPWSQHANGPGSRGRAQNPDAAAGAPRPVHTAGAGAPRRSHAGGPQQAHVPASRSTLPIHAAPAHPCRDISELSAASPCSSHRRGRTTRGGEEAPGSRRQGLRAGACRNRRDPSIRVAAALVRALCCWVAGSSCLQYRSLAHPPAAPPTARPMTARSATTPPRGRGSGGERRAAAAPPPAPLPDRLQAARAQAGLVAAPARARAGRSSRLGGATQL